MDERLEKALEFSNYMVTFNNKKRLLKEKFETDLLYYVRGSQFTITKELITFVGFLIEKGNTTDIVLTDDNDYPIRISNLEDFYDEIIDRYFSAANEYLNEYEALKLNRSVESIVDYE